MFTSVAELIIAASLCECFLFCFHVILHNLIFFWCQVLPGRNTTLCKPTASLCVTLKLTASRISQSHKWDPSVKLPPLFSLSLVLQVFSFYKSIFYLCYMEVRIDFLFLFFSSFRLEQGHNMTWRMQFGGGGESQPSWQC